MLPRELPIGGLQYTQPGEQLGHHDVQDDESSSMGPYHTISWLWGWVWDLIVMYSLCFKWFVGLLVYRVGLDLWSICWQSLENVLIACLVTCLATMVTCLLLPTRAITLCRKWVPKSVLWPLHCYHSCFYYFLPSTFGFKFCFLLLLINSMSVFQFFNILFTQCWKGLDKKQFC